MRVNLNIIANNYGFNKEEFTEFALLDQKRYFIDNEGGFVTTSTSKSSLLIEEFKKMLVTKYHIDGYDSITVKFNKNDLIKSLSDGVTKKYSGFLTLVSLNENSKGYDSFNEDLVVYLNGEFAEVIEKGVDHEKIAWDLHIKNVRATCDRLGCSPTELLKKTI